MQGYFQNKATKSYTIFWGQYVIFSNQVCKLYWNMSLKNFLLVLKNVQLPL